MADHRAIIEAVVKAMNSNDFSLYDRLFTDDFVDEYPQSGELIRGPANARWILENYPGADQLARAMEPRVYAPAGGRRSERSWRRPFRSCGSKAGAPPGASPIKGMLSRQVGLVDHRALPRCAASASADQARSLRRNFRPPNGGPGMSSACPAVRISYFTSKSIDPTTVPSTARSTR